MDKVVLRRWLKAGFIDKGTRFATEAGTPQGGIISPVIANMTLDGLEAAVDASVGQTPRARRKVKVNVNRYADDFVVTGVSKEILEQNVLPAIKQFLIVRGLNLGRENQSHSHRRWVRFPWAECT
jgi:RNA-directed DNA polymerase